MSSSSVLVHYDTTMTSVLGVWWEQGDQLLSIYVTPDTPEEEYAMSLVLSRPWEVSLERLPEASPYVAAWAVEDRKPGESAKEVLARLV